MQNLPSLLKTIVENDDLHALWLNTLSMMENAGSRKISAGEHETEVTLSILKHASEEARHAYFLKTQIKKINHSLSLDTYTLPELMAPVHSYQYLHQLDMKISRYLSQLGFEGNRLRYGSYLLTTYAIEERADVIYPAYEKVLNDTGSSINVRLIIAEEAGHLEEMNRQMAAYFDEWEKKAKMSLEFEERLYENWLLKLYEEVHLKTGKLSLA